MRHVSTIVELFPLVEPGPNSGTGRAVAGGRRSASGPGGPSEKGLCGVLNQT